MTQTALQTDDHRLRLSVTVGGSVLDGTLIVPRRAQGLVIFALGDDLPPGPRSGAVARRLNEVGLATLLIGLVGEGEAADLALGSRRLLAATEQAASRPEAGDLPIGYFGIGSGAAVALLAASERPRLIGAVVAADGRPDLASAGLVAVRAPTLLIVGGDDQAAITRNQAALPFLPPDSALALIPGARSPIELPSLRRQTARLAQRWFARFMH